VGGCSGAPGERLCSRGFPQDRKHAPPATSLATPDSNSGHSSASGAISPSGFIATDLGGGDIPPFIGFPVAAILYWIFTRNLNVAEETRIAEQQMHEIDPQGSIGLGTS